MLRRSLLITVAVAVVLGLVFLYGPWSSDRLVFSPATKVCQLTGEFDKQRNQPTRNFGKEFGVTGTDLGYPVPWNDKLLFLFGDTRTIDPDDVDAAHAREELAANFDSVASAPLSADIEGNGCVDLEFFTDAPNKFRPLRLRQKWGFPLIPPLPLGVFQTPISGFARGNELFAFFSVRDNPPGCAQPEGCALGDEGAKAQSGGQAKLAKADENGTDFTEVAVVSRAKFQWPVAVVEDRKNVPGLPEQAAGVALTNRVVLIWGSGREEYYFRRSYPFFAVAPLGQVETMSAWRYFAGTDSSGQPKLVAGEQNAVPVLPFGNERHAGYGQPPYHKCVGEFSVGYVTALKKWVMLYSCGNDRNAGFNKDNVRGIHLRTADAPWGPWSNPRLIFKPANGYCHFMHRKATSGICSPNQPNPGDLQMLERDKDLNPKKTADGALDLLDGGEYAPFLIPSYTAVKGNETSLYFVMSTWNPYQVVLMRTRARPLRSYIFSDVRSALQRGWDRILGGG